MGQGHLSTARLIGVYDADGTVIGELGYVVKRALGRGHCSLCAITHGAVRERRDWQDARAALPVPFEAVHRDEQPRALAARGFVPPFVAVETGAGDFELLLDADALEACEGSPAALVAAIEHALGDASRWSRRRECTDDPNHGEEGDTSTAVEPLGDAHLSHRRGAGRRSRASGPGRV